MKNPHEFDQGAIEQIHALASRDTPQGVSVAPERTSLIVWALGRFGVGLVFAYSAYMMYMDNKALTERLMIMTEKNMELQTKHIQALESVRSEVTEMRNRLLFQQHVKPTQ